MIGNKGTYYRVELAVSDPRQGETWWRDYGVYANKADADTAGRQFKRAAVRVIKVTEECVTGNKAALILMGESVKTRTRRKSVKRVG